MPCVAIAVTIRISSSGLVKQPSARPAAPEMPALAQCTSLAAKDQHHENQRLQLGQGKLKLIARPEENPE